MLAAYKYGSRRWYWRLRMALSRMRHAVLSFLHKQRSKSLRSRETFSIAQQLTSHTLPVFLIALLFVLDCEVIEWAIFRFSGCLEFMPLNTLAKAISTLNRLASQNAEVTTTVLTVLASTSGLFLGLYFTAISVVLSSSFAHSPNNMRDLLLNERVGNRYIKALAVLTVACIVALCLRSFGYPTAATTLVAISVLGCFSVFCFLVLGTRAFSFFDPMELCRVVYADLMQFIRDATVHGYFWYEPAFQAHYQKLAARAVRQLETLMRLIGAEADLTKESSLMVLQHTIYSMGLYARQRSHIPTQSYWYSRVPRHKSWFLHDDTVLSMALNTQTGIMPEMVADPYWLETRLDEAITDLLTALTTSDGQHNLGVVQAFLSASSNYFEKKGHQLEVEHGVSQLRSITQPIVSFISKLTEEDDRNEVMLATLDAYLLTCMSPFIGLAKTIRLTTIESVKEKLDSINWNYPSSIYKQSFPPLVLPIVEDLQCRLQFEVAAEGQVVTPCWFVHQLVAMEYSKLMHTSLEAAFDIIEQNIVALANNFIVSGRWTFATLTATRGLESVAKVDAHIQVLRELIKGAEALTVETEFKWQEWDWNAIKNKCGELNQKCIEILTRALPGLAGLEHEERLPDSFGQAYNVICQRCYEYLMEGNAEAFAKTLPPFFLGALAAHDKLRTLVSNLIPDTGLTVMVEPLVDIMELCGYARVYSELLENPALWNTCQTVWDRYLSTKETPEQRKDVLRFLISTYEFRRSAFGLYPRDIFRTRWQMSLNAVLRDMNLINERHLYGLYGRQPSTPHNSPLIRALCRGGHEPHVSGSDIFLVTYLMMVEDAEGLEYQDRWHLRRAIDREESRGRDIDG